LPEASSDSIFAIIGEELGLVGILFFVILPLTIFVWRGLKIAQNAPDMFGRMIALGITVWIGWQATINIGAITCLLTLTGAPLPFISQGGTALVFVMIGAGILLNISRQTIHDKNDEDVHRKPKTEVIVTAQRTPTNAIVPSFPPMPGMTFLARAKIDPAKTPARSTP